MIKYPKIKILGDEENKGILTDGDYIVIQEKIDGGNFRFWIKDGKLYFGSRTQELIDEQSKKQFQRCIDYVTEKIFNNKFLKYDLDTSVYDKYVFFGENCIKHTVSYDWSRIPPFLGYDIYDLEQQKFLDWDEIQIVYRELDLSVVPELRCGNWDDDLCENDLFVPKESFYGNQCEGIVIKNYGKQLMAKIVAPEFKEKRKENFGKPKKYAQNNDEQIVSMYCQNPRIQKIILKLRDLEYPIDRSLMKSLPSHVWWDICEEEWKEILYQNYILDIKNIRRLIAKRCLAVLDQYLINNFLNSG